MRIRYRDRRMRLAVALLAMILAAPAVAAAATFNYTVDSTDDLPDAETSDGVCATAPPAACTLRAAVMQANVNGGTNVVHIPAGVYVLKNDLEVSADLIIVGSSDPVIIDANGAATSARAFEVTDATLSLQHVTIRNGNALGYGGAIYAHGGAVLDLSNVSLLDNSSALAGGAIYAVDVDNVNLTGAVVQGNTAQGNGGGIAVVGHSKHPLLNLIAVEVAGNKTQGSVAAGGGLSVATGSVSVTLSSVHDNTSAQDGGGVYFFGFAPDAVQLSDSVFGHNTAVHGNGGALATLGQSTIERTQFFDNSANFGGAIAGQSGPHVWTDITISANQAFGGGGVEIGGGDVSVARGRIDGNIASDGDGGGFEMINGSYPFTLTDSVVFGNGAVNGGGIWTTGPLTATSSAIYGNHASTSGGGIYAGQTPAFSQAASVDINDTILDHNGASVNGGGLYVDSMAQARLYSSTITANGARQDYPSPGNGGGIFVASPAAVSAVASVLAYNFDSALIAAPSDCSGTLTVGGYAFVGSSSGCTIIVGGAGNQIAGASRIDPQLSAFLRLYDPALPALPKAAAKFGRVPLAGSPLIDAGPPTVCTDAIGGTLLWDEIGQVRALGARCDIGAVEFGAQLDQIFFDDFES